MWKKKLSKEPEVTYRWICNNCTAIIEQKQERYHCSECENFDLCKKCCNTHPHLLYKEVDHRVVVWKSIKGSSSNETLFKAFKTYSQRLCFGLLQPPEYSQYKWFTYQEILNRIISFANGLSQLLKPRKLVAICSKNCIE